MKNRKFVELGEMVEKLKSPPTGMLAGLTALVKQAGENLSNTVYKNYSLKIQDWLPNGNETNKLFHQIQ